MYLVCAYIPRWISRTIILPYLVTDPTFHNAIQLDTVRQFTSEPINDTEELSHWKCAWLGDELYNEKASDEAIMLLSRLLHCFKADRTSASLVAHLIECKARISEAKHATWAIDMAIEVGHPRIVELLLNAKAVVNAYNEYPLRDLAEAGHSETMRVLINAKADFTVNNHSPLRYAAFKGKENVVSLLISLKSDIHADNDDALCSACDAGHHNVVSLLLEAKADTILHNNSPIEWASDNGHAKMVSILLEAKAQPTARAIQMAYANEHDEVVTLLLAAKAVI